MLLKKLFCAVVLFFLLLTSLHTKAQSDRICGKWMSAEKNLLVEVYRQNGDYRAKILWFKNDDNSKAMDEWTDKHNPDEALRNRKILGMNVVKDLVYDPKSNTWEHGHVYDAKTGHYWDAAAYLANNDTLKVTGYWHFKFIGHTMTFKRVS